MSVEKSMDTITYTVSNHVATLTLNRPERRNAINADMRTALRDVVYRIKNDPDVRVLVLAGSDGHFCAGGDLKSMQGEMTTTQGRSRMHSSHEWLSVLLTLDKPIVAAVDGSAYGAGFGLALAADIILVTPRTRFGMAFLRFGLIPDFALLYTLPRMIGIQRTKELVFSTRELTGEEALSLGIATELVAAESLTERAAELASALATASPDAVSLIKRALNSTFEHDLSTMLNMEADGQGIALGTDYRKTAITNFINKQPPSYKWPE